MVDISYNFYVNRGLITPRGPKWLFNWEVPSYTIIYYHYLECTPIINRQWFINPQYKLTSEFHGIELPKSVSSWDFTTKRGDFMGFNQKIGFSMGI